MRLFPIVCLLSLAACSAAEITSPPIPVTPINKASAVGLDVYARDRARGNPVPRFRGQDTVEVRAFGLNPETEKRGEITGAACEVNSGVYKASFATPANIAVPNYGSQSPAIFVRCQAMGLSGSVTVDVYNKTNAQRTSGAGGAGALGSLIIHAVAAANVDPENDVFAYPGIRVQLK